MLEKPITDKIFIGIDVSKEHLDIFVHPLSTRARVDNGAKSIAKWLKINAPSGAIVVFEATGGYERTLQKSLKKRPDLLPQRIHPAQVKSFARAFGKQAKTDAIDAEMLARAAQQLGDSLHNTVAEENIQELRDLLARKAQLQDILHGEQCRAKLAELSKTVLADLQSNIDGLKKRIIAITEAAKKLVEKNKLLKEKAKRLQAVVGVGEQVAMTTIAFLPELGQVNRKKIAALAGLAPITRQSGKGAGKAHIRGGRQPLKKALYMAALVGIRYNETLNAFYQSLLAKRKPKMVALIATARKLLIHLNALEKNAQIV
jgi:transposase